MNCVIIRLKYDMYPTNHREKGISSGPKTSSPLPKKPREAVSVIIMMTILGSLTLVKRWQIEPNFLLSVPNLHPQRAIHVPFLGMLHKIIKTLNISHPPRGRSLPEKPQHTTPSLPLEIWWVILEMALYSSPTVLEYFAPSEIALAYGYCSGGLNTHAVMQRQNATLKKCLRQVCKGWKGIIDSIRTDYQPVPEGEYRNGQLFEENEQPTILDTRQYTMITVEAEASSLRKVLIKFRYTHPVSALTMRTVSPPYYDSDDSFAHIESLSDIVSFPKQLKVFRLHMDGSNGSIDLLKGIQEMSIPLTTLSLFLTDSLILQTCLTIPTLVNLLISIPYFEEEGTRMDPWRYQWKLPALRNLSLAQPSDDNSWSSYRLTSAHPFYIELLKRHRSNLQSLLIDPMTMQVHDQASPLCNSMGYELCTYIRRCTRLESVTLMNRGTAVEWMDADTIRGIPIWSQSDVLNPSKIVTFVPIKK
ncbi:hypothetical protein CPB86DRAFT_830679 [Serendipita vermifera]|nr:hypothetical protein CPB86DRAFT_830679 [Serendipita vermifera]